MNAFHETASRAITLALLAASLRPLGAQRQATDTGFRARVPAPAFPAGDGPLVLLDEAHTNFHTLDGRYLVFGRVLLQDGFLVQPNREPFSRATIGKARVLVIANALNAVNAMEWKLPTPSVGTTVLEPSVAWQVDTSTPSERGDGLLQGTVVHFGKGRVAVFDEAAMFSAQVAGPRRNPMGMNDPAAPQNAQFLLNVMHWLSGLLGP